MSKSSENWSVLKYDLNTVLAESKLPCLVKLESIRYTDLGGSLKIFNHQLNNGLEVKFEKEIEVYFAHTRVLGFQDSDWNRFSKGETFTEDRKEFVGKEILVPLEYEGKIRLLERNNDKEYFNIKEVVDDFPRMVKVESDAVCLLPGCTNTCYIVTKCTVLQLDRMTVGARDRRGARERYLICRDMENNKEVAFRVMSPIHFTKVSDPTKYTIKKLVEHLPLPKSVEFVDINPYDVVSGIDDEAKNLLIMLSGPVEILDIKIVNLLVGHVTNDVTVLDSPMPYCDTFALPVDEDIIINTTVHVSKKSVKDKGSVAVYDQSSSRFDILLKKLYFLDILEQKPIALRHDVDDNSMYEVYDTSATPPVPPKHCDGNHENQQVNDSETRDDIARLPRHERTDSVYVPARLGSVEGGEAEASKLETPAYVSDCKTNITKKQPVFVSYSYDEFNYVEFESSGNLQKDTN